MTVAGQFWIKHKEGKIPKGSTDRLSVLKIDSSGNFEIVAISAVRKGNKEFMSDECVAAIVSLRQLRVNGSPIGWFDTDCCINSKSNNPISYVIHVQ